ncbi:adhesion regulating molecule [Phanerochaete sordida]|uniref:Adhesion regulating molecule n=1 Tax=Phanerochaete sordida TaxID=48140 RepID=A0A9P3GSH1_9APHY|nr:adhesion regulating molecule [Phanerochaete sordida]
MSEPRIAFKAGRAFRREGTNWVDPSATKGAILLQNGDDGLLHFIWKNRGSNNVEEDLILFPGDASFVKVSQSAWGRTYVLKFSSSDQRHFFWMQDADSSRDLEFVENVNRLLADPENVPIWAGPSVGQSNTQVTPAAGPSSVPAAEPPSSQPAAGSSGGHQPTAEELAQLQQIISSMGGGAGAATSAPDFLLQDILTPANLQPLFRTHPELVAALFPHLPPDLPVEPSAEVLEQIVASPQFRSAVRSFDVALSTGALQGFVRALGLPEEAGNGFEAFLRAIQEQANSEQESGAGAGERMDTD